MQLLLCLCAGLSRISLSSAPHQGLGFNFYTHGKLPRQAIG
ncbi:hypothetical protein SN31241_33650 [Salmonella enterica subsp. enterica serovar Newport str. USMARC-S3124.1]|nr:hypothetical protein SN31241_33650 [Salmonella enterica subsp. enterica serovar Newport str. USMARC-S3124.1]